METSRRGLAIAARTRASADYCSTASLSWFGSLASFHQYSDDVFSSVLTRSQRAWIIIRSPQNVETLRNAALNMVAGIAFLYFIVKTLQASAAQAYADMLGDNIPEFNIGYITNVTKENNLKSPT